MIIKAIGFDFFGTLVNAKAEVNVCIESLRQRLCEHQISISSEEFLQAYRTVTSDYRRIRQEMHKEIGNCVWIAETIKKFGYTLLPDSPLIVNVVDAYFSPWILTLQKDVSSVLSDLRNTCRMGLISNFTNTKYIQKSLRDLGISDYFDCVIVSEDVGWRKPYPVIFKKFLEILNVEAEETLFVGDELDTDILGAKKVGMKTAQIIYNDHHEASENHVKPDFIIHSLSDLKGLINRARGANKVCQYEP